jgi:hypothetical protein
VARRRNRAASRQAPDVAVTIDPAGGTNANPTTPITVAAANGKLVDVTVTNATKGKTVAGTLAGDGLSWVSTEALGYGTTYKVLAHAVSSNGNPVEHQSQLTTLTPKQQANANLIPAPSSVASTGVGVGQPIVLSFGQSVKNKAAVEKQLTVESTPKQDDGWFWIDDKNVHYRPKEYWQAGTTLKVTAKIYGIDFGNGVFGAADRTEIYKVHDFWIAKADGSTNQMQILHNGQMVKSMPFRWARTPPRHTSARTSSRSRTRTTRWTRVLTVCAKGSRATTAPWKSGRRGSPTTASSSTKTPTVSALRVARTSRTVVSTSTPPTRNGSSRIWVSVTSSR